MDKTRFALAFLLRCALLYWPIFFLVTVLLTGKDVQGNTVYLIAMGAFGVVLFACYSLIVYLRFADLRKKFPASKFELLPVWKRGAAAAAVGHGFSKLG